MRRVSRFTRTRPGGEKRRGAYLGVVISAGVVILATSLVTVIQAPPGAAWVLLLVLTMVAASFPTRMLGFPVSLSIAETFTITAALLFGPSAGTLCVAVDGLVISLRLSPDNRSLTRTLFNIAAPSLAMWVAAHVFFAVAGSPPLRGDAAGLWQFVTAMTVFVGTYFILNSVLIAGAVAVGRGPSWPRVWRKHFLPLWVTHFAAASIAGLLLVGREAGLPMLPTLVLAFPVLLMSAVAFSRVLRRLRRRSARLGELKTYAAALRSTEDAVVLASAGGEITFMNPAAERLTGWTAGEAQGLAFDAVVPINGAADGEPPPPDRPLREHRLLRRDGLPVDIEEARATIRDEDGSVIGTITTFRDISIRKANEVARREALHREQEARRLADEANRTKDEFLATLSHELRTPATAISGWAHLLKSGRLDSARTNQAIAALERSARAQTAVLNDVLDVSRIVRGTLRLDIRRVNLGSVILDALETVQPAREAKSIGVDVRIDPALPMIDADPDRLRQVLWNLLSNAVKFTGMGGEITVTASQVSDVVRVRVADNGQGIAPDFLPLVFERFRQEDQSSAREHGGLGLGLAIVRHLVEAHGGVVAASSDGPGCGAEFTVDLPAVLRRRGTDRRDDRAEPSRAGTDAAS